MLKQQLEQLSSKEQHRLLLAAIIIAVLLIWLLIWQPISDSNDSLKLQLSQKQSELQWMKESATRFGSHQPQQQLSSGEIQAFITRQSKRYRLQISRIQQTSRARVQVQFEKANFNQLTQWIAQISSAGVQLDNININRLDQKGNVTARVIAGVAE